MPKLDVEESEEPNTGKTETSKPTIKCQISNQEKTKPRASYLEETKAWQEMDQGTNQQTKEQNRQKQDQKYNQFNITIRIPNK